MLRLTTLDHYVFTFVPSKHVRQPVPVHLKFGLQFNHDGLHSKSYS